MVFALAVICADELLANYRFRVDGSRGEVGKDLGIVCKRSAVVPIVTVI